MIDDLFQIRGVASKQLVHDQTKTIPATFLSFQQVICSLPPLDIHSNKERHRFDLRDNTDQTRYVGEEIKMTLNGVMACLRFDGLEPSNYIVRIINKLCDNKYS